MCGICGLISANDLPPDAEARVVAMRDSLTHRGPDDEGVFLDRHAALGHRRLSIVDLAGGHQPLSNEDAGSWIVFNGEIYNHRDIRAQLESSGHRYRTRSDTETIVHAYEQWGDQCVTHFRGMFAFAIWDQPGRRLLLARDRLGIKPLYWARSGTHLLFGSEIKAILASGLVPAEANEAALSEVLSTRYTAGERTLFRGINKLLPGHLLVFEGGEVRIRRYWDLPVAEAAQRVPTAGAAAGLVTRFRELLEESVRLRLMADVPLGMFLSGGIDSSAVAAIMSRLVDRPVKTFSVGFRERAFNELEHSRVVARAIGAEAHEVLIDDADFFGALPRLVWHEDEPIAHPSSVPLFFVSALAQRHVKVVLTGEGSDELLAGYGKYPRIVWNWRMGAMYERLVPARIRRALKETVVPRVPGRAGRYARRSFLATEPTAAMMALDNFASIRLADQRLLLTPGLRELATAGHAYGPSLAYFEARGDQSTLIDRLLYTDVKTYLVELLMKQDQMSMATSIESRVPFLDHHLVEFACGLPDALKLSRATTKRILREAAKDLLPSSILERKKMGFPVPFGQWTRTDRWNSVVREVLLDRRCRERGLIDPPAVDLLLRGHAAGKTDGADRLWSLLNLELWYRTFIDGEGVQSLPHANSVVEVGSAAAA